MRRAAASWAAARSRHWAAVQRAPGYVPPRVDGFAVLRGPAGHEPRVAVEAAGPAGVAGQAAALQQPGQHLLPGALGATRHASGRGGLDRQFRPVHDPQPAVGDADVIGHRRPRDRDRRLLQEPGDHSSMERFVRREIRQRRGRVVAHHRQLHQPAVREAAGERVRVEPPLHPRGADQHRRFGPLSFRTAAVSNREPVPRPEFPGVRHRRPHPADPPERLRPAQRRRREHRRENGGPHEPPPPRPAGGESQRVECGGGIGGVPGVGHAGMIPPARPAARPAVQADSKPGRFRTGSR